MWQRHAIVIVAASLAGHALASSTSMDAACGQHASGDARKVALASMRSKTPLYVIDHAGRLVKLDLASGTTTTLSDHRFDSMPSLRASADGRWLSYSGVLEGGGKTQDWLYDRRSGSERLVYEHPAWGGGIPAFSPDSRYLAISASYDKRWESTSGAGLFLFDTATARLLRVTLPTKVPVRDAWTATDWSQDGKLLLILVRGKLPESQFSYVGYAPASGRIETLSGHYDPRAHRHHFKRGAQRIPAAEERSPKSDGAPSSARSPGGTWRAYFEQRQDTRPYRLVVANKAGVSMPVAAGSYNQCEGYTLHISGWLDERHLVYRNGMMKFLIFDAETGNTADLLGDDNAPLSFTW